VDDVYIWKKVKKNENQQNSTPFIGGNCMSVRKMWVTLSVVACWVVSGWGNEPFTVQQAAGGDYELVIGNPATTNWKISTDTKLGEYVYAACLAYCRSSARTGLGAITTNSEAPFSSNDSWVNIRFSYRDGKSRALRFETKLGSDKIYVNVTQFSAGNNDFEIPANLTIKAERFYDQSIAAIVNALAPTCFPLVHDMLESTTAWPPEYDAGSNRIVSLTKDGDNNLIKVTISSVWDYVKP
jgi:hypothetical protein